MSPSVNFGWTDPIVNPRILFMKLGLKTLVFLQFGVPPFFLYIPYDLDFPCGHSAISSEWGKKDLLRGEAVNGPHPTSSCSVPLPRALLHISLNGYNRVVGGVSCLRSIPRPLSPSFSILSSKVCSPTLPFSISSHQHIKSWLLCRVLFKVSPDSYS